MLAAQPEGITVPEPSPWSRPYWDGCARAELRYQRCGACGSAVFNPSTMCRLCGSTELAWQRSEGRGTVYSWSIVWKAPTPAFEVPYAPAIVDVEEGFQMISAVIGCEVEDVAVGLRVRVEFHPIGSGFQLPYFRPIDQSGEHA
jgi:uncharacterized OB-fold protein